MSATGFFLAGDGHQRLFNQSIPKTGGGFWPNLTDIYVPANPLSAMVCLHGGTGTKSQMAYDMKVIVQVGSSDFLVNWQLLTFWHSIAIFPQGQACTGITNTWNPLGINTISPSFPNGISAWDSHDMYSQNDDTSFLQDLSSYITTTFGIATVGKTLMGHSEGGIMTMKMWHESPTSFRHHCTVNGPSSSYYVANPVTPSVVRPLLSIQGGMDTTIADYNAYIAGVYTPGSIFDGPLYWQVPSNITRANVAFPNQGTRIGAWVDFQSNLAYNGDPPVTLGSRTSTPIAIGNLLLGRNASGSLQQWELDQSAHQLSSVQACLGTGIANTLYSRIANYAAHF